MRFVFLLLLIAFSTQPARGVESLGLRFVVDVALESFPGGPQATRARLAAHVEGLNAYFRNSQVGLAAEIVDIRFVRIESVEAVDILDDMAHERRGFAGLFDAAAEYGADYTVAVVGRLHLRGRRGCGRAYAVNRSIAEISSTRRALAVVDIACGAHTLAHELGHLMGLNHGVPVDTCDPGRGHRTALTPYALGYGEGACDGLPGAEKFGTIMVGGWMKAISGNGRGSLPMFSNPRIRDPRCGRRGICGDPLFGDAARALNEHARYYAGHETPDAHTLPYASSALAGCLRERYRGRKANELAELSCPGRGVESLAGIERLGRLTRIDLSGNDLRDVDILTSFDPGQIEYIDLSANDRLSCASARQAGRRFPGRVGLPAHCDRE